ncbi:MAG: tRNA (adenosine(37)-N6)-dimethylallyltransferase MiaA [Patescibacteria group bacterium]
MKIRLHSHLYLSPLIVILGPTASGKTDLAVDLAREFNGEIVNADSRQIYREINIASAKPPLVLPLTKGETKEGVSLYQSIPHHLFNVVKPNEGFNVTHFQALAFQTIDDIISRRKLPFLVGGTGLWISAVVDNFAFPNVPPNEVLRQQLQVRICHSREIGNPEKKLTLKNDFGFLLSGSRDLWSGMTITTGQLYQQLRSQDPDAALFIDRHNRRRIIRALEVIHATGKPFSLQRKKGAPRYRTLELGPTRPIEELEKRIAQRLNEQMKEGLEKEARTLFSKYDPHLPALSSINLREWKEYFNRPQTLPQTLALIRLHNRQYAKRQMTWFKKDKRIQWIKNKDEALSSINFFLHH